ncbi:MAG: hypothetical protein WBM90_11650 [Acidimicrobiia bacterium]
MRVRPTFGALLALAIAVLSVFQIIVELTSAADAKPIFLVPVLLGAVVGLVLSIRVPGNNIGLVVLVATLGISWLINGTVINDWAMVHDQPLLAMVASQASSFAFGAMLVTILILLPIWFPDGIAINRWSRWTSWLAISLALVQMTAPWFSDLVCIDSSGDECLRQTSNPWGIPGFDGFMFESLLVVATLLVIPAIASAILRWKRSSGVERVQLRWFILAAIPMTGAIVLSLNGTWLPTRVGDVLIALALCGVWISIGVAVLKYRLYEIDRIISRTLSYTLVIGLLGGVFALIVWLPGVLIGGSNGRQLQDAPPFLVATSTLAAAALFNPLRRRAKRLVDRHFNRSRYDAEQVVAMFAQHLSEKVDTDQLADDWAAVVASTMEPSVAAVWIAKSR